MILLLVGSFFSLRANGQKLDFYTEPGTDFSKFKTYTWERADKAVYPSPDLDQMFMRVIEAEFARRGLRRVDTESADLVATYQIAVLDDMEWSSARTSIPWVGVVGMNPGVGGAMAGGTNRIQKGSFILDLYDATSRHQIWQARATKTLADTTDINKREKNLQKVMAKIIKKYPA